MNKIFRLITSVLLFTILLSACSSQEQADAIFFNGKVYTVNENFDIVEALAIKDGKILSIGSNNELLSNYRSEKIIDLQGKAIFPGFIDGHTHFYYYAKGLAEIDLSSTNSFEEMISAIQSYEETHPDEEWIIGFGWDQNKWPDSEMPSRDTLDILFPNKVLALSRIDGHAVLTNQKGLDLAKIEVNTNIAGGEILIKDRKTTGVLIDQAAQKLLSLIPQASDKKMRALLQKAQVNCFSVGLTSIVEAGLDKDQIDMLNSMHKDSTLQMRIYAMLNPTQENFDHYFSNGHFKTDHLSVRSFKVYADGALGSRGACLLKPYNDAPNTLGLLLQSPQVMDSIAEDLIIKDFQMNTHAIGDSAIRLITNIYAKHLKGKNDKRWRVEHAQVIHPNDLSKFGQFNILASVQPTHATSDMHWIEERLGEERSRNAYRFKTLLTENNKLIIGSDFPVENINPLYGFHSAVSRQDKNDQPEGGWMPSEKISRENALKAMTIWAAYGQFEESEKGSLKPGKVADLVILDQDIMEIPQEGIRKVKVMQTWSGGKKVFDLYKD